MTAPRALLRILVLGLFAAILPACGSGGGSGASTGMGFRLIGVSPERLSLNNPRQVILIARFDRAIDPTTVTSSTFVVTEVGGGTVATSVMTYYPVLNEMRVYLVGVLGQYLSGVTPKTYRVTITSGVIALDGTPFPGDSWDFSVPASDDVLRPSFAGITSATVTGPTTVSLGFTGITDPDGHLLNYYVYVSTESMGEDFLAAPYMGLNAAPGADSVTVHFLTPGTKYYFLMRARDETSLDTDANLNEAFATPN